MSSAGATRPTPRVRTRALTPAGIKDATRQVLAITAFGAFPAIVVLAIVVALTTHRSYASDADFRAFWSAGRAVLHGRSPYPQPDPSLLVRGTSFVYPIPAAYAMVPFALLPFDLAATLFAFLLIAAIPLALRLVGVRDWRCYGIAILSEPVVQSLEVGAVTPLLMLGVALIWRYRDRRWAGAAALAGVIVLKIFLWPLLLWFALTRRFATAVAAAGLIAISTLGAWSVLGFDGLLGYPHLLQTLSTVLGGKGYSLRALGLSLGSSPEVAAVLPWVIGGTALVLVALRSKRPDTEQSTFTVAIAASLALSPIVWLHYFALLFVPVALKAPRFSPLWALPLAFWAVSGNSVGRPLWQAQPTLSDASRISTIGSAPLIAYTLAVAIALLGLTMRLRPARA